VALVVPEPSAVPDVRAGDDLRVVAAQQRDAALANARKLRDAARNYGAVRQAIRGE
jgi:hypothetical protein